MKMGITDMQYGHWKKRKPLNNIHSWPGVQGLTGLASPLTFFAMPLQ